MELLSCKHWHNSAFFGHNNTKNKIQIDSTPHHCQSYLYVALCHNLQHTFLKSNCAIYFNSRQSMSKEK